MQAVVDSPTLLALEATNPVSVRRYAWAIGSCFISVSGMLLAPTLGLDVNIFLLVYIAAFGFAAVGGFSSLPITFAAAIGIGITMNVMSDKLSGQVNSVVAELYTQIPFLVLVAALILLPRARLSARPSATVRKLRPPLTVPARLLATGAAGGIALAIAIPFIVSAAYLNQYTTGLGFAVVLLSLGLLLWTSGQISLCQMSFAAIGATTFAHASASGFPWLAALAVSVGVAVAAGAAAAVPSFRLTGVHLAVATFGFGLLLQNLIYPTFLMFGQVDSVTVHRPQIFGINAQSGSGLLLRGTGDRRAMRADGDRHSEEPPRTLVAWALGLPARPRGPRHEHAPHPPLRLLRRGRDRRHRRCAHCFRDAICGRHPHRSRSAISILVVLLAVLAFCGSQPLLSPIIAAFIFEVVKIYRPFTDSWFTNYEGAFFGVAAIAVAVVPGIKVSIRGRRFNDRAGRSPVTDRSLPRTSDAPRPRAPFRRRRGR